MDLSLVSQRLAAAVEPVAGILQALPQVPLSVEPPTFYVGEITQAYDQTFGGMVDCEFICRILTSSADDIAGQELLKQFIRRSGATSIKAAIEADPTLGGACDDLHVTKFRGHRLYRVADQPYYGGELVVRVIGTDSEEE